MSRRLCSIVAIVTMAVSSAITAEEFVWDVGPDFDPAALPARDVQLSVVPAGDIRWLQLEAGDSYQWPGITIKPEGSAWDLSRFESLALDVKNLSDQTMRINMRVDSLDSQGNQSTLQDGMDFAPGEQGVLRLPLKRKMSKALSEKLFGMRGYPDRLSPEGGVDSSRINQVLIFITQADKGRVFRIRHLRAEGTSVNSIWSDKNTDKWFPMIDRYGQYMHRDWPGKTHSDQELKQATISEQAELKTHASPPDRNRFGGWTAGPQLEATGHFRAVRHAGRWWLADPEGCLFWSHGIDCVRPSTAHTPITDREHLFAELPPKDSMFGEFYGTGSGAPHGYYQNKGRYEIFNFTGANLLRKYGPPWRQRFNELCHQRLRSWGLNTIANWSDREIYRMERTPYVVTVGSGRSRIEGSTGYWGKFPDPFADEFGETTRRNMEARKSDAASPWCVGVFVDNELAWGEDRSLATAALASPAEQPAKQAFIERLKAKYVTIDKLNETWGAEHEDWTALAACQTPPDESKAKADLEDFYTAIAEQYFRVCREAVKKSAPETLYLGCRFAWVNDRAVVAASKYCDVIGFNKYRYTVADFSLPEGVDKPAIIGEFHFGALDRGMFHTGLKATANQQERADTYESYVRGALENEWLVGTHWFQFGDQATTGRSDGENYQIGFLDVCDKPYPEIVQASRKIAAEMYPLRLSGGKQPAVQ